MDLEEVCETSGGENQQRSIGDDFQQFVIVISHPSRTYKLRANDRYQHRLWFDTLKTHCKNVDSTDCKSDEDLHLPVSPPLKAEGPFYKDFNQRTPRKESVDIDRGAELQFIRSINSDKKLNVHIHNEDTLSAENSSREAVDLNQTPEQDDCLKSPSEKLVDDEVLSRYLQNTAEKAKLRRMSSLGLDGDASIEKYTNELDSRPDIVSFPALSPLMHETKTDKEQNSNNVDHRLQPSFSFGDETIQKRLERAMSIPISSPCNIPESAVEEYKNDNHIQHVESTDQDLITMVEHFSFHDDSSLEESDAMESHSSSPIFKANNTLHVSAEKEESKASSDEGQNLQNEIPVDSWHSSHTSLEKCEATKNEKPSFDSDCSYKPDENYETIEWDDSD
ncbi:predicted protein [Chaetoceros tenuissimus]|uniref:PH domain-containing protein n=1 Tax=Chaetoceros tenuissimus TaxID=426638 RepID=A0AAD3H5I7_9STRA|nr:predicted protein [Chaetoceros tenuissimus]